jgi:hypothetical protein
MTREQLIRKMIKATKGRAFREVSACLLILVFFGSSLPHLKAGSARFDGCILLVAAAVLISVVTLKFTLSEKLLQRHPTDQTAYWNRAFLAQARLLRLVPLWYLTPVSAGILLFSVPAGPWNDAHMMTNLVLVVFLFAVLSWLNRTAAARIEEEARTLSS